MVFMETRRIRSVLPEYWRIGWAAEQALIILNFVIKETSSKYLKACVTFHSLVDCPLDIVTRCSQKKLEVLLVSFDPHRPEDAQLLDDPRHDLACTLQH